MENPQPTARNSILIASSLIFLSVLIIVGYWIYQDKIFQRMHLVGKTLNPIITSRSNKQTSSEAETAQNDYVSYEPNEHARKKIQETNELVGYIIETVDPSKQDNPVRILTIQSDVIDQEKLTTIDFNEPQNDLPLIRKEFKLLVSKDTKIENGDMMDLKPGDFIYVSTELSIYQSTELPALGIKVIRESKK